MVRWIILAVLVVLVAAALPLAVNYLPADVGGAVPASRADEPTGPLPEVVFEGDLTHDFGLMSEQNEGSFPWVVRNDGEGPLQLRFIEKPCTCTAIRLGEDGASMIEGEEFVVEPGETAEITLTWETRDKIGEFSTYARFATNDYERNPTFTLTVKGQVAPAVVVDPPRLDFPASPSDESTSVSLLFFSPTFPEMAITSEPTTSRPNLLHAETRPLTEEELKQYNDARAGQIIGHVHSGEEADHDHDEAGVPMVTSGYRLTLTLEPGMPLGRFADSVSIKTDHPLRSQVEIPVSGQIVGPISAMPERVYMPGVVSSAGRSSTVTLNVRNQQETHFDVSVPASLQDLVEVGIEPSLDTPDDAKFRQYRLEVRVPKGAKPGFHKGTLILKTDHPQAEEVKVPVELVVRGG